MDDNTFSEYKRSTLPYQRSGNVPQMREQQAFPQRPVLQQTRGQQTLPQRPVAPTLVQERPTSVQKRPASAKMPRAKAQALVHKLKQGIVIASFLSFGTFSALVMSHNVGTTTQSASAVAATTHVATSVAATAKKTTTVITTQKATPTTTTKPKATTTTTNQGGGYGFGTSTPTSQPVSGSQTS